MTDTSSNNEYVPPTDADLEKMITKLLDDIFGTDTTDSETPEEAN